MNSKPDSTTRGFLIVLMFQILTFLLALAGVVLMIYAISNDYSTGIFMSGLFMALSGSAAGVIATLFSLRMY